jgi:hypothetical protein
MDYLRYLDSTLVLFETLGGAISVPPLVLAFAAGFIYHPISSSVRKFVLLLFSITSFVVWQTFFVFEYKVSPTDSIYLISGWNLTQPAQIYVDQHPFLSQLTHSFRNAELAKAFGAKLDVIWTGVGLTTSRIAGLVSMALVVFCFGMMISRAKAAKEK